MNAAVGLIILWIRLMRFLQLMKLGIIMVAVNYCLFAILNSQLQLKRQHFSLMLVKGHYYCWLQIHCYYDQIITEPQLFK